MCFCAAALSPVSTKLGLASCPTPHRMGVDVAALTDVHGATQLVANHLERLQRGLPLQHLVDRVRGY